MGIHPPKVIRQLMFVRSKIDEWLNVTDAPSKLKNLNPETV